MALSEAPPFWWQKPGWQALLLSPLSRVWGHFSARKMERQPSLYLDVPVICVGNFIAGGAGKTPTTLALVKHAKAMKLKPGILSRGYRGGVNKPALVDLKKHDSRDVGDEPLLLAKAATTVVSADRPAGARMLVRAGCNLIIMDDGLQNPSLHKDFRLVVVDAKRGIGNGHTHPGGPLRVPIARQLPLADAVLIIGEGEGGDAVIRLAARSAKPIQLAKTIIKNKTRLKGKSVLAYAGIADPDKFFSSLLSVGAKIDIYRAFGDHHHYHHDEIEEIITLAEAKNLHLVSTSKDIARLNGLGEHSQTLVEKTDVVEIDLKFGDREFASRVINKAINSVNERKIRQSR